MLSVFVVALVLRVGVAVLLAGLFSGTLVLDDTTYHQMATDKAAGETGRWDQYTEWLYWSTAAFTVPVTLIYEVFGPQIIAAQVFVALVGAAVAALTTRLAIEAVDLKWALTTGAIVAFLPSQVFWSGLLMKDATVWLALTALALTVAVAGRSAGRKLAWLAVPAALSLGGLAFLRLHTLVVASWAMMIAAWAGTSEARMRRGFGAAVIAILIPWFIGGIGPAGLGLVTNAGSLEDRRFNNAVGANTAIIETSKDRNARGTLSEEVAAIRASATELKAKAERLEERARAADARAQVAEERAQEVEGPRQKLAEAPGQQPAEDKVAESSSVVRLRALSERLERRAQRLREQARETASAAPPRVAAPPRAEDEEGLLDPNLRHLPRGLSAMLLEPFPVPFEGSLSLRLARLESLIWYPIVLLALIGLWRGRHHLRVAAFPILAGAAIFVMYALTEGNVGTAHRHRGEVVWVAAFLASLGAVTVLRWWRERRAGAN